MQLSISDGSQVHHSHILNVRLLLSVACLIAVGFWGPGARAAPAEGIQPATDRPQPKSPVDSAACIKLPAGFQLDLVAAEPQVREPSAMAFDEKGQIFVCEIHGYNLDGYLDIIELNKTGKLDREVRRVRHATPGSQEAAKKETYGTVKRLRDIDGDGRMDVADVWADRLPPCYGVIAARGGVIVICAPHILFLADRDNDGRAEVIETLFTGFGRELIERGISNPRWGPDNWIYVAAGGGGGTITGPKLASPVRIGHTDFRFRADGSQIEPVSGKESMFGLTLNDFGDRFHTAISYVAPLPYRSLARNPYVQSPPLDVAILPSRTIFPISQPDPWRKARGTDPAWVQFYGPNETQPNGNFTAPSGQLLYRADALPEQYRGNFFVCDPANNLIHRSLLEQRGCEYVTRRAPENEHSEFLASTDQWFRPINLIIGPDGAIYVVDMYREIIEDFSAIPRFLQQQYAESLIAGKDRGRLWRLSFKPEGTAPKPSPLTRLDSATADELVNFLDHPNPWWRETSQRLLLESADRFDRIKLSALIRDSLIHGAKTPAGKVHGLYTLQELSQLKPTDVLHLLQDESSGVRVQALRLAESWISKEPDLLEQTLKMTGDADPCVRLQTALTLGGSRSASAIKALARLAAQHGDERWMSAAIISSLAETADLFLGELLAIDRQSAGAAVLLGQIGETIGAQRKIDAIERFLDQTAGLTGPDASKQQLLLLTGLVQGLKRGRSVAIEQESIVHAIERLLASPSTEVSLQAVQVAGLLQLRDSPALQAVWEAAARTSLDESQPVQNRLTAIESLAAAAWPKPQPLAALLDARQPVEVQLAAVTAISSSDHQQATASLLENWAGLGLRVQDAIIDAFFARQDRLPQLLDAIERDVVPASVIGPLRREQLVEHSDTMLRERARKTLARRISDDRSAVLKRYEPALTLPRDPSHGEAIFNKTCARCHRLGDRGLGVGPDLLAVRTRPDQSLLIDILDPSGALARGYTVYTIATNDGRVHTGLLAGEAATSVTLRNSVESSLKDGKPAVIDETILRRDIDEMRALSKSLMPDGLEKEMTPQDLADLIGFLRRSTTP